MVLFFFSSGNDSNQNDFNAKHIPFCGVQAHRMFNIIDTSGDGTISKVRKTALSLFVSFFMPEMIVLPRQARNKHRERAQKGAALFSRRMRWRRR